MRSRDGGIGQQLIKQLLQDILSGKIAPNERVNAKTLSEDYNVSRTPVLEALAVLEKKSIVTRVPNKGFFVAESLPDDIDDWAQGYISDEADEYQRFANDWLTDDIPETVTEQFLRERYQWTKAKAITMLNRATREGWVEPNPGYGWRLLPVAKTTEAFSEIYRFRIAIEPVALLEPSFKLDRKVITQQRDIQHRILDSEPNTIPDELILKYGATFHEELIKLSGNPYFFTALQRVNKMRKLMEYKAEINRERLVLNCSEHLEILDLIEQGSLVDASYTLRRHLSQTLNRKVKNTQSWANKLALETTKKHKKH